MKDLAGLGGAGGGSSGGCGTCEGNGQRGPGCPQKGRKEQEH